MVDKIKLPMFVAAIDRLQSWDNKIKVETPTSGAPSITVNIDADSQDDPFVKEIKAALYAVAQHTSTSMYTKVETVRKGDPTKFNVQINFACGNAAHEKTGIKQMATLMADHEVNFPGAAAYRSKEVPG